MTRRHALAAAVVLLAIVGCQPVIEHRPGATKQLTLKIKLAALPAAELNGIGAFSMQVLSNGNEAARYDLAFSPTQRTLTWLAEPDDLPVTGRLELRLTAADFLGTALPIGGRAGPVDLDAAPADGPVVMRTLIGRLDSFSSLGVQLAVPRFGHSATALADRGVLVVGGSTDGTPDAPANLTPIAEWLDFWGTSCSSTDTAVCAFGTTPSPRRGHIALALGDAFGAGCPNRNHALVGLGADASGNALSDLYLFDPEALADGSGGFALLTAVSASARIDATAFASSDCRVAIVGGRDSASGPTVTSVDVLLFDASGVTLESSATTIPTPTSSAVLIPTGNALGEVVVAGGADSSGAASNSAAALRFENGSLRVCALTDSACNGGPAAMICRRIGMAAGVIEQSESETRALVIGGESPGTCGQGRNAEIFTTAVETPYNRFTSLAVQPSTLRAIGHSVSSTIDGEVLIVGGVDPSGTVLHEVEVLQATPALTFVARPALTSPRAFHRVARVGGALTLVGGYSGTGPVGAIDLYVPGF